MRYLLVIDSERNAILADADNDIRMPIGAPLTADQKSRVATAVWSPTGQWTAWAVDSEDIDGIREIRLHDEATDQSRTLVESVSAFYLCPSPCGRWLSHLSPGPLGLELGVSDVATGALRVIERGQPLFWSWSPDSTQLAVHAGKRVLVSDNATGSTEVLTDDAGFFVTPGWLPDGSVVYAHDDRLIAARPGEAARMLVANGSVGRFLINPQGRHVAYVAARASSTQLVLMDLIERTTIEVTSAPVAGFFWSPDATKLAVLEATDDGRVQWLIVEGASTRRLPAFRPSRSWARAVLPFVEQYAHSHTPWSGDAADLVAPAIDEDGAAGALIHRIHSPTESRWIADVELAWWA